jgi:dTMP kinase
MGRLQGRSLGADRFERDSLELQEARRRAFLEIAAREPDRCVLIDASAGESEVAEAIRVAVSERLLPQALGAA